MPFWDTTIIQINQKVSYIMKEAKVCSKSEFYYSLSCQYTISCFADISTEEACTVLLGN